ncbi:hypothetical protein GKZ89_16405 [Bacillus mangrovi]|uniref:YcaO domain-containing protein n=1 Tax=Metabacillus mangrovi TaxID=1491830 RepID=A0A7X2S874_9BACI|nr:hypothetical protein [Metabacillus mangrovi]MTH54986.1 hypothetical protein [Metabacillus mangrovi]
MNNVDPSMRLKVNRDTVHIPGQAGGVYFRNNTSSFLMEGSTVAQWVEVLLPKFDGTQRLDELTAGLTPAYRDRVFEMAGVLYRNGYVRDVSRERSHGLSQEILERYASQIAFLDELGGSGEARFEDFRTSRVLAAGSEEGVCDLLSALLDSGLQAVQYQLTDPAIKARQQFEQLAAEAREQDHTVSVKAWSGAFEDLQAVLYAGESLEELLSFRESCSREGIPFIPAFFSGGKGYTGMAAANLCFPGDTASPPSAPARSLLANAAAFEWLKEAAGVQNRNKMAYILNAETLEGSLRPIPSETGSIKPVSRERFIQEERKRGDWLLFFSRLTNPDTGMLRIWEEGELSQLPLPQCRVQAADPLTGGQLEEMICTGFTQEEARREAALSGIEAYLSCLMEGASTGETAAEAICRGLEKALEKEAGENEQMYPVTFETEDPACRYYCQVLHTLGSPPVFGVGKEAAGFPVIWTGTRRGWKRGTGLNATLAARNALKEAITLESGSPPAPAPLVLQHSFRLNIPAYEQDYEALFLQAEEVLAKEGKVLEMEELHIGPELSEGLAGVFRTAIREGETK